MSEMISEAIVPISPRVTLSAATPMPVTSEPRIIDRYEMDGVLIERDTDGNMKISVDPNTHHVNFNSGAGPRENSHNLRQVIKITPRPASGTQALGAHSAQTRRDLTEVI